MIHSGSVLARAIALGLACLLAGTLMKGCASAPKQLTKNFEATAYCDCGQCCGWERGSWKCLKLDLWNKYVSEGKNAGRKYTGKTASGVRPVEFDPGLLSFDTVKRPWKAPTRVLNPTKWTRREGTIAADTDFYPFGTRMYVPGYGWGVVRDRGGAIKGPNRLDLFYDSHSDALEWGRKNVEVVVVHPGE